MSEQFFYNDDKTIVLTVNTGGSEAHLKLSDKCLFFDESEIIEIINRAGVKYGFQNAKKYSEENQLSKKLGESFLIARETPIKSPTIELNLLIPKDDILPENYSTELSFDEILTKKAVLPEQTIATLIIVEEGLSGTDIFGREITAPTKSQETPEVFCGDGVICKENKLISTVKGYPILDNNNRLSICSSLALNDIKLEQNKLYTVPCNVFVSGNLSGKGLLDIDGDLYIEGNIEDCTVHLSGNLTVVGQIKNSILIADKRANISNASHSRVAAGDTLNISERIHQSILMSDESILGNIEGSGLIDCSLYAAKKIDISSFKKATKRKVSLNISYTPATREYLNYLHLILKQTTEDEIRSQISERIEAVETIVLSAFHQGSIVNMKELSIIIRGDVSEGVEIRILSESTTTQGLTTNSSYFIEDGNLKLV